MLEARLRRELLLEGGLAHLSAASGLVCVDDRCYVIADDELSLGLFDLHGNAPGRLIALAEGVLPEEHDARKAAKPDFESLALLADGSLLALGSGSTLKRQRGLLYSPQGRATAIDLAPLMEPLRARIPQLNIEGAFVSANGELCLLNRGTPNACIRTRWGLGAAPVEIIAIDQFELGLLDGVPLGFTDATPCAAGGWVFSAAAEDTADSYLDGPCAGSVIGLVDAAGKIISQQRLVQRCKVEGLSLASEGEILMVTDADDRARPAQMLTAVLA